MKIEIGDLIYFKSIVNSICCLGVVAEIRKNNKSLHKEYKIEWLDDNAPTYELHKDVLTMRQDYLDTYENEDW